MKGLEAIKQTLSKMYDQLDSIQELNTVQDNEELMWEIGEAMGSLDNAITVIEESKDSEEE